MERREFLGTLTKTVTEYIELAEILSGVLADLKQSFLAFDTYKINKLLDEKLVVSEQLMEVHQSVNSLLEGKYGEATKTTTANMLADFPEIKQAWKLLQQLLATINTEVSEVKRVLTMIGEFDLDLHGPEDKSGRQSFITA